MRSNRGSFCKKGIIVMLASLSFLVTSCTGLQELTASGSSPETVTAGEPAKLVLSIPKDDLCESLRVASSMIAADEKGRVWYYLTLVPEASVEAFDYIWFQKYELHTGKLTQTKKIKTVLKHKPYSGPLALPLGSPPIWDEVQVLSPELAVTASGVGFARNSSSDTDTGGIYSPTTGRALINFHKPPIVGELSDRFGHELSMLTQISSSIPIRPFASYLPSYTGISPFGRYSAAKILPTMSSPQQSYSEGMEMVIWDNNSGAIFLSFRHADVHTPAGGPAFRFSDDEKSLLYCASYARLFADDFDPTQDADLMTYSLLDSKALPLFWSIKPESHPKGAKDLLSGLFESDDTLLIDGAGNLLFSGYWLSKGLLDSKGDLLWYRDRTYPVSQCYDESGLLLELWSNAVDVSYTNGRTYIPSIARTIVPNYYETNGIGAISLKLWYGGDDGSSYIVPKKDASLAPGTSFDCGPYLINKPPAERIEAIDGLLRGLELLSMDLVDLEESALPSLFENNAYDFWEFGLTSAFPAVAMDYKITPALADRILFQLYSQAERGAPEAADGGGQDRFLIDIELAYHLLGMKQIDLSSQAYATAVSLIESGAVEDNGRNRAALAMLWALGRAVNGYTEDAVKALVTVPEPDWNLALYHMRSRKELFAPLLADKERLAAAMNIDISQLP
ncbi:hypothetical protein [Sediminispirochaeta smaragdinae]|uniref:Lipoprotein n=1 Tax=Sediminispirochaeta smaragdinae (strain DSM 11293 / JCM 15392 / SEBR 4228) TaxID=573413 RepID=E1R486_SEDSS|nr:hypothetical protein [Sediminispirochaeta smaragdinae]ADK80508.1 hypothetical protein Spirs_1381 [Sediminispirochaeta smaragdinae DSM 11293]